MLLPCLYFLLCLLMMILLFYSIFVPLSFVQKWFFAEEGIDQVKARKLIAQKLPFSRNTINNVLREKRLFGNVLGGAAPKSRLRRFDKLSAEQKEDIRKLVCFVCIIVVAWNGFKLVVHPHTIIQKACINKQLNW